MAPTADSPLPKSSMTRRCLVCSVQISSIHLDMDACRACASFFKRSIIKGSRYVCRQSDGKCALTRYGKRMCRSCRYKKCRAVGLQYEPRALRVEEDSEQIQNQKSPTPITLLQRIGSEYKALCERRRHRELQLIRPHEHQRRIPHPTEELYSVHIDTLYPTMCAFGEECFTFFTNAFSSLLQLRLDDQITIFKHFMPKLSMFECYHRSRLIWKEHDRYSMISMVTCFDTESGIDGDTSRFQNSSFLSSSASSYAADHNAILQPLFNRIELIEEELHVLIALLLCEIDVPLSDKAHQYLDDYRTEALVDLQMYYREELGLEDYSRRLGNLMTLSHTVQECKSHFQVFFRFAATIFDIHVAEKSIREMII